MGYFYITPAGAKSWCDRPRVGGKQKSITFGKYPAIGLAEVRARHLDSKKLVANVLTRPLTKKGSMMSHTRGTRKLISSHV
jgi:hypothetical protein